MQKKNTAIFLIFIFLLRSTALEAYPTSLVFPPLFIISDIGEVVYKFQGKSKQKVICIEDLHCNPDVQTNIAAIIKNTKDLYADEFKFIGVEGSIGDIDITLFSKLPDPVIKKKILNQYLQKGYISGAELYAIKYDESVQIFGIENRMLYERNLGFLQRSYLFYSDWQKVVKNTKTKIGKLINIISTEEVKKLRKLKSSNDNLGVYLKEILGLAKNKLKISRLYPNIQMFLKAFDVENKINESVFKEERIIIEKKLADYFQEEDLVKIKDRDYFYQIIKKMKIKVANEFQEMHKFLEYKEYESRVDSVLLLEEIEDLEQRVSNILSKDREQLIQLLEFENLLELMTYYFSNTASIYDVKEWQEKREILYHNMRYLAKMLNHNQGFSEQEEVLRQVDKNMDYFYGFAEKRNEAILKNLFENSQDSPVRVVIFGGYHTQGMMKFLRAKNISFEVIRPKINKPSNKRLYLNRLEKQLDSREDILKDTNKYFSMFEDQTLMVITALHNPSFNKKVFQSAVDEALKVFKKQALLNFINEYAQGAGVNFPDGIFWQGKIGDIYQEIFVEENIFKIRDRQDVPLDFVVFKNSDGSEELGLTGSQLEKKTVMLDKHFADTADMVAASTISGFGDGIIIGFRPMSIDSTEALRAGATGKGLNIKGKSSPYGASLRGKIFFEQKWSKLLGNKSEIAHYNKINHKTIKTYPDVGVTALLDSEGRKVYGIVNILGDPILDYNLNPIFVSQDMNGLLYLEGTD
ncbi:MAG: hypothetical protein GY817_02265 [bacterium]|nr:hypothetical protein [bacterium]